MRLLERVLVAGPPSFLAVADRVSRCSRPWRVPLGPPAWSSASAF